MLWDDFLNSDWHDWRGTGKSEDRLDKPGWMEKWLSSQRITINRPAAQEDIAVLKQLRGRLLQMVQKVVAGTALNSDDLESLNQVMAGGSVIRQIVRTDDRYTLEYSAAANTWQQLIAEIVASFAQTLAEGETSRIRICENPDCLWVYYDDTRNRSKRYCDDKACGNLIKVRRFRARKKAASEQEPKRDK